MNIILIVCGLIIGGLGYIQLYAPSPKGKINSHLNQIKRKKAINQKKAKHWLKRVSPDNPHIISRTARVDAKTEDMETLKSSVDEKARQLNSKEQRNKDLYKNYLNISGEVSSLNDKMQEVSNKEEEELLKILKVEKEKLYQNILSSLEEDIKEAEPTMVSKILSNAEEVAQTVSREYTLASIYQYTEPSSVEKRKDDIIIEKDIIKGRIVGKAGRNLNYIEELTGAYIVFNDKPGSVTIASPCLVRQNITRYLIKNLMRHRHIDEKIIDREYNNAVASHEKDCIKNGKKFVKLLGLKDIHPDLVKLIGKLNYRTSYGQNVLWHSYEVAVIAAKISAEMNLDVETVKLGGFLHDIGKAVDRDNEGGHDELTKVLLEKYGYGYEVVHAAWTHHEAVPIKTLEAFVVKVADAVSASRPGARHYSLDNYTEKIIALEGTGYSFPGVKKAYAISAGRELRVVVDSKKLNDVDLQNLSVNLAKKVEEELNYPGSIKINAVRRTDAYDCAKPRTKSK